VRHEYLLVFDDPVLVVDDFTNSGSTLFGAVSLVQKMCAKGMPHMKIFVSHFVASYDPSSVSVFKDKLHALGDRCHFLTTNSIPLTTDLLKDDAAVTVFDLSEFIASLLA
jgi:phosphoribosylpyrophosphate synthetase